MEMNNINILDEPFCSLFVTLAPDGHSNQDFAFANPSSHDIMDLSLLTSALPPLPNLTRFELSPADSLYTAPSSCQTIIEEDFGPISTPHPGAALNRYFHQLPNGALTLNPHPTITEAKVDDAQTLDYFKTLLPQHGSLNGSNCEASSSSNIDLSFPISLTFDQFSKIVNMAYTQGFSDGSNQGRNTGEGTAAAATTTAVSAAVDNRPRRRPTNWHVCNHEGCSARFTRRYNLKTHQEIHKPHRERPFKCSFPECGKAFHRSHDLERHYQTHFGGRANVCNKCGFEIARPDALKRHDRDGCEVCSHGPAEPAPTTKIEVKDVLKSEQNPTSSMSRAATDGPRLFYDDG
ncbi:hypothetical protein BJ742DRAFT_822817 [Cladochytrium replicatum]|nr:hypothetical protein BJ742DRAFT_822817 [Cladochytrium replicatum]